MSERTSHSLRFPPFSSSGDLFGMGFNRKIAWFSLLLTAAAASIEQDLLSEARGEYDWTVRHRRELHQIPELKYEEHATSQYLRHDFNSCELEP